MATALTERNTEELVAAAQTGDRAAFGMLYVRFAKLVHGVLLANALSEDVPDLLQEVFFAALKKVHTLRDPPTFGSWVSAIARNMARMHHRSARETVAIPDAMAGPRATDDRLKANEVMAAIKRLPDRFREPLLLRLVEEMNGEEIAAQLGLSHGTVRVYLHHGMALLRMELGDRDAR